MKKNTHKKAVTIIEAILPSDVGQDSPLLSELLKMSGLSNEKISISGSTKRDFFIDKLLNSPNRFLHISAHGGDGSLYLHGDRNTKVSIDHITSYAKNNNLGKRPMKGKFITISACGEISAQFTLELGKSTGATAIISPLVEVSFDESAIFMTLFYFSLAKHPAMKGSLKTSQRIAHYIDSFQRAKMAYLNIGGTGAFRLDYWWKSEHTHLL